MNKRLNIGFSLNLSNAGPSKFLNNLRLAFRQNKLTKTSYFFNPFTDCNIYSNRVRNPWQKPFIYRVDGIGYDTFKSREYIEATNNSIVQGINKSIGVVYQSKHSKKMVEIFLDIKTKPKVIVLNGTNLDIFSPIGDNIRAFLNIPKEAIVFMSSAQWRPQKRLKDIIEVYKIFKNQYKGETYLILLGKEEDNDVSNNIIFVPFVRNSEMPKYLRSANIYMFLSWLDVCPNSVIEALACNLPVICTNQGGTKEIIKATNGGIIVDADDKYDYKPVNLQNPPKPNYRRIVKAMNEMVNELNFYKKQIDTKKIDIKYVANAYYSFLKTCYK